MQRKPPQAPGRRQHVALEVVLPSAQLVQHQAVLLAVRQQARLVGFASRLEDRHGLRHRHLRLVDRHVGVDDGAHASGDRLEVAGGERRAAADAAVVRAQRRRRVLHEDRRVREELGGRRHQHQRQRSPIDPRPIGVVQRHRRHIGVRHQRHRQLAQPSSTTAATASCPSMPGMRLGDTKDVANRRRRRRLEDAAIGQARVDGVTRGRETDRGHGAILAELQIADCRLQIGAKLRRLRGTRG